MKNKFHKFAIRFLTAVVLFLLALGFVLPALQRVIYRADAQVALGNAKVVRQALQTVGIESYGMGTAFYDPYGQGGVTEEVYREVLLLSKAPGDFWVLALGEDEWTVEAFLYRENDYAVYYQKNPLRYEVYREENYIRTRKGGN